jgi:serine/threonine protein phosphatase 1
MTKAFMPKAGERIYAVGDVHGRADLFAQMLSLIRQDNDARAATTTKIIVLGDIIDRGPDSAELVHQLMRYSKASRRFIVLMGNHEQIMLAALDGDIKALQAWLKFGGAATLLSWGLPEDLVHGAPPAEILAEATRCISEDVLSWLNDLPLTHVSGDVVFVHAGIRPGVKLGRQDPRDLLWIRDAFLESEEVHSHLVVHGHSINANGPERRENRIGVDTGAYSSGRLTALGIEGGDQWFLST